MQIYEYKVVPAPEKAVKAKGVKPGAARFAHTLETLMNALGAEGWEYLRADTLPATERAGLTGSQKIYRNILIFRRILEEEATASAETPILIAAPVAPDPAPETPPEEQPGGDPAEPETPVEAPADLRVT
ncbi:DUF4177 domain-containing protein [Rhodophyticola sp. CCM32]|uniref:DUF4177 domain-containing protein n=1 Tax=Rhodophyticola sp. CCM32 TaxID=2916397 RepID=UPI00107F37B7|nr:DUF4177 domain-containing protein [Rhodophyticola sp. CCM32]QBX99745.1 DUF4177 domain-containing protein [Rhodophyticola sp. CCM32]